MSVVPADFELLRRYNLAEIFDATPKASKQASNELTLPKIGACENAPDKGNT